MAETLSESEVSGILERLGVRFLVRGWLSANNVVISGGAGAPAAVVDTGYVTHAPQTLALVRHALGARPLSQIVNTHLHSDHCGGNAMLRNAWPDATVLVPHGYRQALSPWDESALSFKRTGQSCEVFAADAYLSPGATIRMGDHEWEIHATPGHDPDAIVLFQRETGVLISGDALWEERLAIIFPELVGDPGFAQANAALDLIERLGPRLVLPGHGRAFCDIPRALAQSRARLQAFVQAPDRHRMHAARALVTYRMLELQSCDCEELARWIAATPIFRDALQCADDAELTGRLANETIKRLLDDGVLVLSDRTVSLP